MKKLFTRFHIKALICALLLFPWWEPPFYGSFLFLGEPKMSDKLKDALNK